MVVETITPSSLVPASLRGRPCPEHIDFAFYDPRDWGARCDECILRELRDGHPVPPAFGRSSILAAVGEAPGGEEIQEGRPFAGPSGFVLDGFGLKPIGLERKHVTLLNVLDCRPPDNQLGRVLTIWRARNKARKAQGLPETPSPQECCFPRLAYFLSHHDCVVPLGTTALKTIMQTRTGIEDNRGTMHATDVFGRKQLVLPTYHPAYVSRNLRNRYAFRVDWMRALRYFRDALTWTDPVMGLMPSVAAVKKYLSGSKPIWWYDVETDGLEPLTANMRCIGIGDEVGGIVIPFLGIDGSTKFYCDRDEREIKDVLRWFFRAKDKVKAGHNCSQYDRVAVEQFLGVTPWPIFDTLPAHRLGMYAELRHSLGFLGSTLTDVRAWKAGHTATKPASDHELWVYNITDVVVNARVGPPVIAQLRKSEQTQVYKDDMEMQDICVGMHRLGLAVDQGLTGKFDGTVRRVPAARDKEGKVVRDSAGRALPDTSVFGRAHWEIKLSREREEAITECRRLLNKAGRSDIAASFDPGVEDSDFEDEDGGVDEEIREIVRSFNPNSPMQLCEVIYHGGPWRLPILEQTKTTGNPATGDAVLRQLLVDPTVPKLAKQLIAAVRKVRKAIKLLGYVKAVAYGVWKKAGALLDDGCIHAFWNSTGRGSGDGGSAVTGRLTSSPNMQNWRYALRSMIVADLEAAVFGTSPTHLFACADLDQIELRLIAIYAGAKKYLSVFGREGLAQGHPLTDPHRITMMAVFGETVVKTCEGQPVCHNGVWNKGSGTYKKYRDLAKRVQYAGQYGADAPTVHRVITSAEDKQGKLIYADLPLRKVRKMHQDWLNGVPEIVAWWYATMQKYKDLGYLADPISGRRRYFLDGSQPKKSGVDPHLLNYEVQSGAAGWMNRAMVGVRNDFPFDYAAGTGIVGQFHDAGMLRAKASDIMDARKILEKNLCGEFRGYPITAAAEHDLRWINT